VSQPLAGHLGKKIPIVPVKKPVRRFRLMLGSEKIKEEKESSKLKFDGEWVRSVVALSSLAIGLLIMDLGLGMKFGIWLALVISGALIVIFGFMLAIGSEDKENPPSQRRGNRDDGQ
jgi:hypothetical protein